MRMMKRRGDGEGSRNARYLIFLITRSVRSGQGPLTRDADGGVAFVVAESYLRDAKRQILSLGWHDPNDDERTLRSPRKQSR